MPSERSWDIFCTVVDNYGDIGVCWRLARQLSAEHGLQVRLWVDHLEAFRRICPEVDPRIPAQRIRGVEIRPWTDPMPAVEPADVVVEAFACPLPEDYLAAMAARERKPRWINLEYLSAEGWVRDCHGLASPSPRLPLTRHFFFPGFVPRSGGLLAERGLGAQRDAFRQDPVAAAAFWRSLGLAARQQGELRVSLFCYPSGAVSGLFDAWARCGAPVTCVIPEGVAAAEVGRFFDAAGLGAGTVLRKGDLEVRILPFLEQDHYDRLLWACDCNFVRGEDSFVRAQWAGRPFVWHIYPQEDGVHWHKLESFLGLYCNALPEDAAAALRAFWLAWNRGAGAGEAWPAFWRHQAVLERHLGEWCAGLSKNGDLASNLVKFCADRL